MSGIDREITLDTRHTDKHLPDTLQVQRLLRRGKSAHVFSDRATMESVAQAVIKSGEFVGVIRGYERYGLMFDQAIGYRISPMMVQEHRCFTERSKSMQKTDITSSPDLDPAKPDWSFTEVWIDPLLSPPYVLLLLSDPTGNCQIYDPAEGYKIIFTSTSYKEAQTWLLEDEYEPIEGRLSASEL